jgi:hypothetical protein
MKNEHPHLSRRSILRASLTALSASPALAAADAAADVSGGDDSALLVMGQEWREAWGRLLVLYRGRPFFGRMARIDARQRR